MAWRIVNFEVDRLSNGEAVAVSPLIDAEKVFAANADPTAAKF